MAIEKIKMRFQKLPNQAFAENFMLRQSSVRNFVLIHSRTLCCSKATAGILLKNAWVEVAVGFANRFSTKNHCGLGYYLKIALIWFLFQFRGTSNVVFESFFSRSFQMNLKSVEYTLAFYFEIGAWFWKYQFIISNKMIFKNYDIFWHVFLDKLLSHEI